MTRYSQVGKLVPDDDGIIHIICDYHGELGTITKADTILVCGGFGPLPVLPSGDMNLSNPKKAIKFKIDGILYLAIRTQVVNMINHWPNKKASLFSPIEPLATETRKEGR